MMAQVSRSLTPTVWPAGRALPAAAATRASRYARRAPTRSCVAQSGEATVSTAPPPDPAPSDGLEASAPFSTLFDLDFHGGRCVGVRLPLMPAAVDLPAWSPTLEQVRGVGAHGEPPPPLQTPQPPHPPLRRNTPPRPPPTNPHHPSQLMPEELAFASKMKSPVRASQYLGGRAALRRAMGGEVSAAVPPIYSNARGAPSIPLAVRGSISHKDQVAVGLVMPWGEAAGAVGAREGGGEEGGEGSGERLHTAEGASGGGGGDGGGEGGDALRRHVGVDIENLSTSRRIDLLVKKILTPNEKERLGALSGAGLGISLDQEVLVYFSIKEAVYKAIDPYLERYVGFKEVEINPRPDGGVEAFILPPADAGEGVQGKAGVGEAGAGVTKGRRGEPELALHGHWTAIGSFVLTAVTSELVSR